MVLPLLQNVKARCLNWRVSGRVWRKLPNRHWDVEGDILLVGVICDLVRGELRGRAGSEYALSGKHGV